MIVLKTIAKRIDDFWFRISGNERRALILHHKLLGHRCENCYFMRRFGDHALERCHAASGDLILARLPKEKICHKWRDWNDFG